MKKLIRTFEAILVLLLVLQVNLYAQHDNDSKKKYDFVKNKSVNKSYNVSSSDRLNIKNSFGTVEVKTWNRNEIKVDVSIEVSANSSELAQRILDKITIAEERSGKDISFKTSTKDIKNSKGEKSSMTINYSISMPAANALAIKNDFGAIVVPDFKGEVDLTSKFGSLTTGNLANIKSILVEFGTATLANISGSPVTIKFSKAEIARLSGAVKLNMEFCNNVRLNLDNSLSSLDLKASYSTINLKPVGNLPAAYTITTSFGSLKNTSDVKLESDEESGKRGVKFDYEYTGKTGNGSVPVRVKSSFSKIILGEASEEDMKDKSKPKSKTRTS